MEPKTVIFGLNYRLSEAQTRPTSEADGQMAQLQEEVTLCIYRVLQEALRNVQKHAAAHRVEVRLQLKPDEVILSVQDDGRGFHVPRRLGQLTNDSHFGLVGLRSSAPASAMNLLVTPILR